MAVAEFCDSHRHGYGRPIGRLLKKTRRVLQHPFTYESFAYPPRINGPHHRLLIMSWTIENDSRGASSQKSRYWRVLS